MRQHQAPQAADTLNGFMVEVIDRDGITQHLGPFRQRSQAARWIEQNEGQPAHAPSDHRETSPER